MKIARSMWRAALAALLLAVLATSAPAQLDPKFDPSKLTTPPLGRIQSVAPQRIKLANGMVVFLLENHDLPVISGAAYVRTTPVWIADDKVGLAGVTGQTMRSGGTAAHSGDYLDDRLGAIGASIGCDVGSDLASASFNCLAENATEVIALTAEIMRSPVFPDDKIELARVGLRRAIAGRNDEMLPMLQRTAQQAVFGKGSPWARQPEFATVEGIKRDDLVALHRQVFEPSRMVLAVYGDFKTSDMKQLLKTEFGGWKGAGVKLPALPPTPTSMKPRLVFAPRTT
jgi:zinc protease